MATAAENTAITPALIPFSPAVTLVEDPLSKVVLEKSDSADNVQAPHEPATSQPLSVARRYTLLLVFCVAQFLDAFNNSALFSAM
jgi:hypothetical protein